MHKGSVDYERWQQLKESSRSSNALSPRNDRIIKRSRTPLIGKSGREVVVGNSYSNLEFSNSRKQFVGISGNKRDTSITRSIKTSPRLLAKEQEKLLTEKSQKLQYTVPSQQTSTTQLKNPEQRTGFDKEMAD